MNLIAKSSHWLLVSTQRVSALLPKIYEVTFILLDKDFTLSKQRRGEKSPKDEAALQLNLCARGCDMGSRVHHKRDVQMLKPGEHCC